ncbi:MAG: hypothetical protein U0S36_06000 [Candidatus Nanopelagicales bacterium]
MSDEGRLELDEDGRLVEGDRVVDLADLEDPEAVEDVAPSRVRPWVDEHVAPWARQHRRALVVTGTVAALVVGGLTWVATRPPYVAPTVALALDNAILDGNDLGGPEIDAAGVLSVAYTARAATPGDRVEIRGITGPGLVDPTGDPVTVTSDELGRVVLGARIECRDPSIAFAGPTSYGLSVRRTAADGDVLETVTPLGPPTTELDLAVASHCLAERAASDIVVEPGEVQGRPGVPTASVSFVVRNTGPMPLTVATQRRATTGIELDLSPTVRVDPGQSVAVTTQALVHDCRATPALPPASTLPNPLEWAVPDAPAVTLQVGLGRATALASYPADDRRLGRDLAAEVCSGAPRVSAVLESAEGARTKDGGWQVQATYRMRTDGVRVRVGREHFAGPAVGAGSFLTTPTGPAQGDALVFAPTFLDGGAGRLIVTVSGATCESVAAAQEGATIPLGITMPDRTVYSFEMPADDGEGRLVTAALRACGLVDSSGPVPAWPRSAGG